MVDILAIYINQLKVPMPVQLFKLRGVPDDEADEIRTILGDHAIDYYETPAGNWGISMPSIWLNDEMQLEQARALIEAYQLERQRIIREECVPRTLFEMVSEQPFRYLIYVALILLVLYISVTPFLKLGGI